MSIQHMPPASVLSARARQWPAQVSVILIGSWLLAAASWVEAPMWPVPMTLQTYAVLVIGALAGARFAGAIVAAYLVQGALGLPVFAGGAAGPGHLLGPTGGYLLGFLLAATLLGWLVERGWTRSLWSLLAAMGLAHALVFVSGVSQLALFVGSDAAIAGGLTPFLVGSIIKIVAAALTVRAATILITR